MTRIAFNFSNHSFVLSLALESGWTYQDNNYNQQNYYDQQQQHGDLVNDWNSYQQKLYEQGYYQQPSYNYDQHQYQYHHEPAPAVVHQHKGKECKHKNIHTKHDEKEKHKEEVVATTKKPAPLQIDIGWPSSGAKPSHVEDKLHATQEIISNTFNETIDKVSDQVDKAFNAIKQLVDKSVENLDNKSQIISKEKSKLVEKFNKKYQAIEKHFKKFKGSVKRMEFEDDEEDEEDDDAVDELRSIIKPNAVEIEEGKKISTDIKSSIYDAIATAQEKFNKLVDDQVGKINKKISDVGDKLDVALDKFYSTVEKLKVTPPKPVSVAPTEIDWKPKPTTPIPIISTRFYEKFTTPEYYKYTVPSIKYRKDETAVDSIESTLMTDIKKKIDENSGNDDDIPIQKNDAESAKFDGLIDAEVERVAEKSEEITSDNGKSVDDLQSQIIENVKEALKSDENVGVDESMDEFSGDDEVDGGALPIISTIDDDDNDDDLDEGKTTVIE